MSGGRFARAAGPPAPAAEIADRVYLAAAVIEGRTFKPVVVAGTTVAGRLRVLTHRETREVRAEARRALADAGLVAAPGVLEGYQEWRDELVLRTIAVAVRDPHDPAVLDPRPLAPLAQWEGCDEGQLLALWDAYQDLAAQLDPLGPTAPPLDADEEAEILAAVKKKDVDLLMSFGSRKLALFAITSTAPPST